MHEQLTAETARPSVGGRPAAAGPGAALSGTPVVAGVAYGPVVRAVTERPDPGPRSEVGQDLRPHEAERFDAAAAAVADRLRTRASAASGAAAEVLQATAAMAEDRGWVSTVRGLVNSGVPAPHSVVEATGKIAAMFEKAGGLMAERVTDLEDVRDRVVAQLVGADEPGVPVPGEPSVLIAEDLSPADTAGLSGESVIALVTERGGPTSHTAIIARQMAIPCVVAAAGACAIEAGRSVLVDGEAGCVEPHPDAADARRRVAAWRSAEAAILAWTGPGVTADGTGIPLLANVQDADSAHAAASDGIAEGVGLLRTELAFLDRDDEPTVDEQAGIYRSVLAAFAGRKVVVRTLDAGSDKPLRFVEHGREANPALGVRGIRISRAEPGLLTRQLDAVAAAWSEAGGQAPQVMAPMVATAAEAHDFAAAVRGRALVAGAMIEVPAAALLAEHILAEVDFVSVGTNDLTQYTMAADRMAGSLAELTDAWQPAVLQLVRRVADAGRRQRKPVGVCGEAAADPLLACVLVGLGVTSLSAAPAALRPVGARIAGATSAECAQAAEAALREGDALQARSAAEAVLAPDGRS